MSLISQFKDCSGNITIPKWSSITSQQDFVYFLEVLDEYFASKNLTPTIDDGYITLKEEQYKSSRFGLDNITKLCSLENKDVYSNYIANHFDALFRSADEMNDFESQASDFETVKPFLGVRIQEEEYLEQITRKNLVYKDLGCGLYAVLVYDLGEAIKSVNPDDIKNWGLTIDELIAIGQENIINRYDIEISAFETHHQDLYAIETEHFYGANIILNLEGSTGLIGKHGTILSLPNRHTTILFPINSDKLDDLKEVMNELIPLTNRVFEEGPGSISRDLYWFTNSGIHCLKISIGDNKLTIDFPKVFSEMIQYLEK